MSATVQSTQATLSITETPRKKRKRTVPSSVPNHSNEATPQKKTRKEAIADVWEKYSFRPIPPPTSAAPTILEQELPTFKEDATPEGGEHTSTQEPESEPLKTTPSPTNTTAPITHSKHPFAHPSHLDSPTKASPRHKDEDETKQLEALRAAIRADTSLTPFRAHVLCLLTQVPRGRYTTYKALAEAAVRTYVSPPLGKGKSKCTAVQALQKNVHVSTKKRTPCARAIGSAMRNNPFAPAAPCHRVLASDGRIGGFGGDWGEDGRFVNEKIKLLRSEGVRFDGRGRVVGEVWRGFV